jgi:hypothetical protein
MSMHLARSLLSITLLASVVALGSAAPASAQDDLIIPKVLVRRFPQGQFCALPVSISFIAPTTNVIVTFTATEFVDNGSGTLTWTEQSIDNVSVATSAQVVANTEGPPASSSSENCYIGDPSPTTYFHFNRAGLTLALLERFDTDPASRGWTLSPRSRFVSGRSGPRNVETDQDLTGGSLALGDGTGTPATGVSSNAKLTLSALSPGTSYDLGAWWYAGFVRFPHDADYLTITITTATGTPVAQKSWGALKSRYR